MNSLFICFTLIIGFGLIVMLSVYFASCESYSSNNLLFIHIPKNAGTSILEMNDTPTKYGPLKRIGGFHSMSVKKAKELHPNNKVFIIQRNPYDRFLSACAYYCNRTNKEHLTPNQIIKILLSNDQKLQFDVLPKQNWGPSNKYHKLDGKQTDLPTDCVFWPQWYWLKNTKPDFVIPYENLNENFEKFKKMTGINPNVKMPKTKSSKHRTMDNETKKLVYKFYKKDFDIFGYNK